MDAAHLSVKAKDKASVGYEVVTAINGGDAKAILERRTDIDILFTDVVMPKGIRGLQLAYLARKLRPDLKVVLARGTRFGRYASSMDVSTILPSSTSRIA
jgi:DNA-binding NtrC family response regulator